MTNKNIYRSLGGLDPELIEKAAPAEKMQKKKKNAWVKWVSMAACLSLIVMVGFLGSVFRSPDTPDVPENNIMSYFVITAYASNGESTELSVSSSLLNSGTPKYNIFGHDKPLFHFDVKPSDLESNEAVYERFDISVSYNGTIVDGKDEHILVGFVANVHHSANKPYAYSVMGWFTEPTDIIVNILDKQSREIVETITVNVKYLADTQEYELKVTNLITKFSEQKEAVEANNALMTYLFGKGYVTNYPEWFGGCYIEGNKLYIKLASPSDEERKNISDALAHFGDVVVYKSAEISMTALQEYADKTAKELIDNGYAVTSWYVDSITSNIVISVLGKDFDAVSAWVNALSQNGNGTEITVEIGEYIALDADYQTVEFCADPFWQQNSLSWMYSINVKFDNEKIYLNDILYDQVSYVNSFDLDFSQLTPGPYVNAKMTEELDKIKRQKGCYILETASESKCGQKIAMYVIGDTYYFIRFFDDGTIMRIHSGTIQ